ncbi:hypothetical protein ACQJBY_037399 [Aegilops geniculata]
MATALGFYDTKGKDVASSVCSVVVAVDALPAPPRLSVVVELPPSSLTLTLHPTAIGENEDPSLPHLFLSRLSIDLEATPRLFNDLAAGSAATARPQRDTCKVTLPPTSS